MKGSFATCLTCIDGRVQLPAIHWIKENCHVEYVDIITEPGIDGILSGEDHAIDSILKKVRISVEGHNSANIIIVGHHDCLGNPVDDETHKKQICSAVERLKQVDLSCKITGIWVSGEWKVEKIL